MTDFLHKKIGTSVTCSDVAMQNNIDAIVPKAQSRKKAVATASRRECVYKRTGKPSEPFYEKGGTVKQVTDFFHKKIGTSETCSDVVGTIGLEPMTLCL